MFALLFIMVVVFLYAMYSSAFFSDILHQDKFSVAKIIECFRTSENPQTHHQALLVLGKAASLFPVICVSFIEIGLVINKSCDKFVRCLV